MDKANKEGGWTGYAKITGRCAGTLDIKEHKWYPMSEGTPTDENGIPFRAASFHPQVFPPELLECKGEFHSYGSPVPEGGSWWGDQRLVLDTILDHQKVPAAARLVLLAMIGACLFDIGEILPHPEDPLKKMVNRLEVILFIWGRGGVGKSTVLNMLSAIYNDDPDLVGVLENQSDENFGLDKLKHAFVVIAQDIDSKFNISPTQLTGMTSGTPRPLPPDQCHHQQTHYGCMGGTSTPRIAPSTRRLLRNKGYRCTGPFSGRHCKMLRSPPLDWHQWKASAIFALILKEPGLRAGERVIIRGKYKEDRVVPAWRAMFAMAGNESFTTREQANAGNRLTRRTVCFHFGHKVTEHNRSLLQQMKDEMPKVIWICTWAIKVGARIWP